MPTAFLYSQSFLTDLFSKQLYLFRQFPFGGIAAFQLQQTARFLPDLSQFPLYCLPPDKFVL